MDNNNNKPKEQNNSFKNFFGKYFWIGIVIILVACIVELVGPFTCNDERVNQIFAFSTDIFVSVIKTVGIAVMLGAIFDYAKTTDSFMDFVSRILSDIIVGKAFLSKLGDEEKKDALALILSPSEDQKTQYDRIDGYFKKKISDSMSMWDTNFKTDLVINVTIKKDQNGNVVTCGKVTNRMYKVKDRYEDIETVFERENSNVSNTRLLYNGKSHPVEEGDPVIKNTAGMEYKVYKFTVPENLNKYPYLTIERDIYEPGFKHWTNFHWTSLTPYEGLVFTLSCQDGLSVKEHIIFDEKELYHVSLSEDRKDMRVVSDGWLDANTGFSVTVGDATLN